MSAKKNKVSKTSSHSTDATDQNTLNDGDAPRSDIEKAIVDRLSAKSKKIPAIRKDLIKQIRDEIANGNYDDQRKLEVALNRLLDESLESGE